MQWIVTSLATIEKRKYKNCVIYSIILQNIKNHIFETELITTNLINNVKYFINNVLVYRVSYVGHNSI